MKRVIGIILIFTLIVASLVSCTPVEKPDEPDTAGVTYISLSKKNIHLTAIGASEPLTCEVGPDSAPNKRITWITTDESIAEINDEGKVVANGFGVCLIKAIADNGTSSACVVMVENPNPKVTLDLRDIKFSSPDEITRITALDSFGNDITEDVSWITTNRNVATCYYGEITTTGYGICTIKAVAKTGATASCLIRVEDPRAPSLTMSQALVALDAPGSSAELEALSANDSVQVKYQSTDESVAIYKGGKVHAISEGECAIIATANNGTTSAAAVRVGEHTVSLPPEDIMSFEIKDLPLIVNYVDTYSGEVASSVLITSYDATYTEIEGNTRVAITLNCIKIYDRMGERGKTACIVSTELYTTESDKILLTGNYREENRRIGERFTLPLGLFDVGYKPGVIRQVYMVLPDIVEQ